MKLEKDAYGQEVWAEFTGRGGYEVIERDDGYFGISGGPPNYFAKYKDWPEHQKKAIKFAKGRVLDVGCGAGRVSLYLQKKGFDVTGIDNSPLAIRVCKKMGLKNAKILSISDADKLKPNSFDTIIMFGNNFGLFESFKKARLLLKKFYKITSPKVLILAESNDPYKTDNPMHLGYHKLNRERRRMSGQLRIRVRFERYVGDWFDYLLVSKKEMQEILKGTGWRIRKFINSKKSSYVAIIEKAK